MGKLFFIITSYLKCNSFLLSSFLSKKNSPGQTLVLEKWRNFILNVPEKEYSGFEWQANEFAGRLLVPYPELKNELDKAVKIIQESKLEQYLESDPDAVLSRISPALCKPFGVLSVVIETRVKREGFWPPKEIFSLDSIPRPILNLSNLIKFLTNAFV